MRSQAAEGRRERGLEAGFSTEGFENPASRFLGDFFARSRIMDFRIFNVFFRKDGTHGSALYLEDAIRAA